MSVLHVAAMPFPSAQGTQAAVRAFVDAEHDDGRAPELVTYAHGEFELRARWPHHRIRDLTRDRSLRSGPSLRKVVEDAQLAVAARQHHARMRPSRVVAHHVEAAAACLASRLSPVLFVAHTALGPELPSYLPARAQGLAARAGGALDGALAARASAVAAVSPWLAEHLEARAGRPVTYLPVPWTVPRPTDADERQKARARLGIDPVAPVVLYTGNLDAYQGLDVLVRAFALVTERLPAARLLVATGSDPKPLEDALWAAGCAARVIFAPLLDEPDRRVVHAAADVAWVPRHVPGGLPMKLLDAMARGVPTIASRAAASGLDLAGAVMLAADGDAEAFAAATLLTTEGREAAAALGRRGVEHVRAEHTPARYLAALTTANR